MDEVARKEAELEVARLAADYDAAVEKYRASGSDEDKATKDGLAEKLVAARVPLRQEREAQAVALENEGDGVARPESVGGTSGVH